MLVSRDLNIGILHIKRQLIPNLNANYTLS